jgi:hypothetical protein
MSYKVERKGDLVIFVLEGFGRALIESYIKSHHAKSHTPAH